MVNLFKKEMDKEFKALGGKDLSKSLSVRPQKGKSIAKIDKKRKALGIDKARERVMMDMATRRALEAV